MRNALLICSAERFVDGATAARHELPLLLGIGTLAGRLSWNITHSLTQVVVLLVGWTIDEGLRYCDDVLAVEPAVDLSILLLTCGYRCADSRLNVQE